MDPAQKYVFLQLVKEYRTPVTNGTTITNENSNMADYIIPATTVVPIPVMVLNHYRLIKKYVK